MPSENIRKVTYKNLGWDSSADMHLPPNFDEKEKYPSIVSTHPIGSCKDRPSATSTPRPSRMKASWSSPSTPASRAQAAALLALSKIRRYGLPTSDSVSTIWSRCPMWTRTTSAQSACAAEEATLSTPRSRITGLIKALTSITGVNFGRLIREGFSNFDPVAALEKMGKQRTAEAQGAERNVINYLPASVEQGKKGGITDIDVLEATDYYKTPRGQKPNGATSGLFSFNSAAMGWDAFLHAEVLLTQPPMVVIGDSRADSEPIATDGKSTAALHPKLSTSPWPKGIRIMTCTTGPNRSNSRYPRSFRFSSRMFR